MEKTQDCEDLKQKLLKAQEDSYLRISLLKTPFTLIQKETSCPVSCKHAPRFLHALGCIRN